MRKKELIERKYKEDLRVARELAKNFTNATNRDKISLVGYAQYIIEDSSAKEIANIHAQIKKMFREILLNERNESDIQVIEYYLMEE